MGGKYHERYAKNMHLCIIKRYRRKCHRIDRNIFLDDYEARSRFSGDVSFQVKLQHYK